MLVRRRGSADLSVHALLCVRRLCTLNLPEYAYRKSVYTQVDLQQCGVTYSKINFAIVFNLL